MRVGRFAITLVFALSAVPGCATTTTAVLPDGLPVVGRKPLVAQAGVVVLECRVTTGRRLSACVVVSEEPSGQGFGQAAIEIAQNGNAPRGSSKPGDKVRLRIPFRLAN